MITESIMCLALNVYFEARSQSLTEQIAVAEVVMNRVESPYYPDTVCDVVWHNKYPNRLHKCQFSWACDGRSDRPREKKAWATAQEVAAGVFSGRTQRVAEGAIYYHAHYVQPYWASSQTRIKRIGAHIFYR
jgi:spore germination cell wall hydrolase CwlJ-like protein